MRSIRTLGGAAGVLALSALPLAAQGKQVRCALPDTTEDWFAAQKAWLDDSARGWSDDPLRQQLIKAAGLDASKPVPVQPGFTTMDQAKKPDSGAVALVTSRLPRGTQFPTRTVVGAAGAYAIFTLILGDSALEMSVMHRTMEAGPGEAFETWTAMLEDRTRIRAGRGQLYGTVLKANADGSFSPLRIEDSSHVGLRREMALLPPLRESVCAAAAKAPR
jgi:hypothetical protein